MRIALVKPPGTYADWDKRPLVSISYISAYVQANGIHSMIFDAHFNDWNENELVSHVKAYKPDVVGISAMTHEINRASCIASQVKEHLKVPVVIGGCHVTALPERTLQQFPAFDFGVHGEGEKTLVELLRYIGGNGAEGLASIKGLVFRNGNGIVVNGRRPFLSSEELNQLPFPAYHHYYLSNPQPLPMKMPCYAIFSGRGCPHRCAFCMRVLGKIVRRRSAENICSEIEHAISRYGATAIDFSDEIFLFNNRRTRQVLQMMIDSGLSKRIKWSANTRANMVSREIISLAKEAGCFRLGLGAESGDNQILQSIGKGITVEEVRNAVQIIKDAKIKLGTYFILGHPYETRKSALKTVSLAAQLNTDTVAFGIMVPYPGTKVFKMAMNGEGGYRLLSENWADYDKYGGRALEIEGLPYEKLERLQLRAYLWLYLRNLRLADLVKFIWSRKHALKYFVKKKMKTLSI